MSAGCTDKDFLSRRQRGISMKRKISYTLLIISSLLVLSPLCGYLLTENREHPISKSPKTPAAEGIAVTVIPVNGLPQEDTQLPKDALPADTPPEVPEDEPLPFSAVPAVPDPACFTYEELADGTLRITGYDEGKNILNPYQVIIPSAIDGKPVSTLGSQSIGAHKILELIISEGITTLENNVFASAWDQCLVALPDSAVSIDPKAFYHSASDHVMPIIISCSSENTCAYQFTVDNGLACRLENPVREENAFLRDYAVGPHTSRPYISHIREKGDVFDYIVMEYVDIAEGLQDSMESDSYSSSSIWQRNEFAILVLDKESGAVLQCIDYSSFDSERISLYDLPWVSGDSLLSVADCNFDGYPDLCVYLGVYGTGAVSYDAVFLFDEKQGLYEDHCFYMRNMVLNPDKQCIDCYERNGPMEHFVDRYQYIDGTLTHVACLATYYFREGDTAGAGLRDERLQGDDWQIYWEGKIYTEGDYSDETYQEAYEELKSLYADDGYWEL